MPGESEADRGTDEAAGDPREDDEMELLRQLKEAFGL
jgi:hypothetical protein